MDFWKANKEIHAQTLELIGQNHPDLAVISDEIVVVFREKAGKTGGQVVLGNSKRVSALMNVLGATAYKFILEIASDQWENELGVRQREALLDHLLTSCRCEEDPQSGEFKLSVARPDIMAFRENVDRYGMWFPVEEAAPNPVGEMFSIDEDENPELDAGSSGEELDDFIDGVLG